MALMLFYGAVFLAMRLLDFEFPLLLLVSFFVIAAVPTGLLVVGIIYGIGLLRQRLTPGRATMPGATTLISAFIAATIVASGWFILKFDDWAEEGAREVGRAVEENMAPHVPPGVREDAGQAAQHFWHSYLDAIKAERAGTLLEDPEMSEAYLLFANAVTGDALTVTEATKLTKRLNAIFPPPESRTVPPGASDRAESAPGNPADPPTPRGTAAPPRTDSP